MEVAGGYVKQNGSFQDGHGMAGQNYCVVDGCLLSLSLCRRGFQDLLKVRPSSLFILFGCISSSIASLISRSMCPVLAERSLVSLLPIDLRYFQAKPSLICIPQLFSNLVIIYLLA